MHVSGVQRISADKGRDRCVWRVAKPPGFDMTNNKMPQQYSLQDDEPKIYVLFWQKEETAFIRLLTRFIRLLTRFTRLLRRFIRVLTRFPPSPDLNPIEILWWIRSPIPL
jgi:hypothetical protein